jgi:hypothetical protein
MMIVVVTSRRPLMWGNVLDNINRQSRKPDALIFVAHRTNVVPRLMLSTCIGNGIPSTFFRANDSLSYTFAAEQGFNEAAKLDSEGMMCNFDDDDFYGKDYLKEIEDLHKVFPSAGIIGKAGYFMWQFGKKVEPTREGYKDIEPMSIVDWVAGPTISINIKTWIERPDFRHDHLKPYADAAIISVANTFRIPIRTTGDQNFLLQRYSNKEHKHTWPM